MFEMTNLNEAASPDERNHSNDHAKNTYEHLQRVCSTNKNAFNNIYYACNNPENRIPITENFRSKRAKAKYVRNSVQLKDSFPDASTSYRTSIAIPEDLDEEEDELTLYPADAKSDLFSIPAIDLSFTKKIFKYFATEKTPGDQRLCFNIIDKQKFSEKFENIMPILKHRRFVIIIIIFLHIFVFMLSCFLYGVSKRQDETIERKGLDVTNMVYTNYYKVQRVLFSGPSSASLVEIGATYSPCVKADKDLTKLIEMQRMEESKTGCCVQADNNCYQSSQTNCFRQYSEWIRWNDKKGQISNGKLWKSGPVCGQDPLYFDSRKWEDDISQWPLPENPVISSRGMPRHMSCNITGKPCCAPLQGVCQILTEQECSNLNGKWHPEAYLCSQVNCLDGICGLALFNYIPPLRLFISIFLNNSILLFSIGLATLIVFYWDLVDVVGTKRWLFFYFTSGFVANMASMVLLPYMPICGPFGGLAGILGVYSREAVYYRKVYTSPMRVVAKYVTIGLIFIMIGLTPYADNFNNIFGFITGYLLAMLFYPVVPKKPNKEDKDYGILWKMWPVCALILIIVGLFVLFYFVDKKFLEPIQFINCLNILFKCDANTFRIDNLLGKQSI